MQNPGRLGRTAKKKKKKNRELMRKKLWVLWYFQNVALFNLRTWRQVHKGFIKTHIWLIPLTQLLIVQRSAINMGKLESRLENSEPACLNTLTSDDMMGKLSWILALFPVTLPSSELENYSRFLFVTKLWLAVSVKGDFRCKSPEALIQQKYYFWTGL